jgi:hypothetical protein
MSRTTRRLVPIAVLLTFALTVGTVPLQARESSPAGWFDALSQQLMTWTAGWWSWPPRGAPTATGHVQGHPAKSPPITIDCGGVHDPDGCPSPAPPPLQ